MLCGKIFKDCVHGGTKKMILKICIDFDGVIHSYYSGWRGYGIAADPPVDGAIEWIREMIEDPQLEPLIYSSRSQYEDGVRAMKTFLFKNGLNCEEIAKLGFPKEKPEAFLTIDDRAICFKGKFPTLDEIKTFKSWNKK